MIEPYEWKDILIKENLQEIIIEENKFRPDPGKYMEILRQKGANNIPSAIARFTYAFLMYSPFRKYIHILIRSIPMAFLTVLGMAFMLEKKAKSEF